MDGWGKPLAFCRWPVGSTVLNPTGPMKGDNNDPIDPSGLLESPSWQGTSGYNLFVNQYGHPLGNPPQGNNDATSYRIFPLIASAGSDGVLGLDKEPLSVVTPPTLGPAPVRYFFAPLPPSQNGPNGVPYWTDDLYPTLAPAQ